MERFFFSVSVFTGSTSGSERTAFSSISGAARLPLPAEYQQMEQSGAPVVFLHVFELAW
jgi:hypothetical protein